MKLTDLALLAASATALYLVMSAKSGTPVKLNWTPWKKITSYDGYEYYNDGDAGLVIKYDDNGKPAEYYLNGERIWSSSMW